MSKGAYADGLLMTKPLRNIKNSGDVYVTSGISRLDVSAPPRQRQVTFGVEDLVS